MNKFEYLKTIFEYIKKHPERKEDILDAQHIRLEDYQKWEQFLGIK